MKKTFFSGLAILSSLTGVTSLICISMNNQACKVRPEIINVILFVLKQVNAVVVVIISMIHMQKCVFLML